MRKNLKAYKNYVCPECFKQLNKCICNYYPYSLLFIDEGVQEHIRILNSKGYRTNGCCESHYKGDCISIYISFIFDYGFDEMVLPDGFKFIKNRNFVTYDFSKNVSEEKMKRVKEQKLAELLEWCEKLPDR